ncbi:hypothetical protein SAMN05880582_10824 [Rhizobium sp. RU20A]|uniref:hypothetical protein n=1 Tax=Rhizobium sp. RU20A TaxID=1907412 RepID=UPI0009561316|nr:hypothetical protein [Rhizobium sp. RU20A]SIR21628.1 hypothetical protein SAMN05880582_10824 [Rhizobium sp. RU20A]
MRTEINDCLAAIQAFKTGFEQGFVPAHPMMSGYGVVVFEDRIKAVPVTQVLRGGPNFVRIPIDPDIESIRISQAIAEGGDEHLAMIMMTLRRTNTAPCVMPGDVECIRMAVRSFLECVDALHAVYRMHFLI